MKKDLVVLIDPQNVYLPQYAWACPAMPRAVDKMVQLIESKSDKYDVVITQFIAPSAPVGKWKTYNEANQEINEDEFLNEIVPQLQPYTQAFPLLSKSTYSAAGVLKDRLGQYENIVLAGVVAECCVLATAMELIDMGASVYYLKDAVAGQNAEFEQGVVNILDSLSYAHTTILTTEEYLNK